MLISCISETNIITPVAIILEDMVHFERVQISFKNFVADQEKVEMKLQEINRSYLQK